MSRLFSLLALLLAPVLVNAAEPLNPDQLLERIRSERAAEASAMQAREQAFVRDRGEQARLLAQAKAALAEQQAEAERLKAEFDRQEALLAEQEKLLAQRVGHLGELFGVVRQSAGDIAGQWQDSLLNAQYPERLAQLRGLAESRTLPSAEDLDAFWMTLLEDLAASGRVEQVSLPVVGADGQRSEQPVLRVGTFSAFGQDDFLRYDADAGQLLAPARQPSGMGEVEDYLRSDEALGVLPIDPSRGTLLAQLQREPDFWARLQQGGLVGWVIVALGVLGLCLAGWRMVYLSGVGRKVASQMRELERPRDDNPLGRIIGVLGPKPQLADLETLELKLDEAILQETPPLERGQPLLKLLTAVAPLLGLLGTVTGMIVTFQAITQSGGGDSRLMADGISQALVTTVMGLVVAIPLLFLHALLASRSKALIQLLEQQSAGLIALHLSGTPRRD
ncbi:MotA/TolQ/ExbB proton channel family protein [Pseudomonas sp. S5(2021)]|uniref:MotA/TolQ/ExbB proton channel family protein n=1 Tax=Stutzerimonas balearica TaxID=74829 RepID=UPI000773C172|nr:MotA/TolQ/ExbB proton channel family protein [Stutzerimonas balearica]MBZ5757208.1 MotA/TolQ/ExbB proton channel family protein [Pseudomonas sp. S5(2021)]MCF6756732.1 MotA/TolQ/ExbB proton channel family protein [Stutzerimonas balearica]OMG63822.1 flagellar motor protein MotA [Stutzerimonas balearica]WIX02296.1 MotA/TolQ/ExbB proton channel family protein [Pseudomonas sp. AR5]